MTRLDTTVTEAVAELDNINQEETYLDWDPSQYPVLKTMRQNISMYSTLWHTAMDFHENYEKWYSGPVSHLDSPAIKTKVSQNNLAGKWKLLKIYWLQGGGDVQERQ